MVRKIDNGPALIEKWLRNKNTIEFLGIWEEMYNADFNIVAYEEIMLEADVFNMALFGMTARQWRDKNEEGSIYLFFLFEFQSYNDFRNGRTESWS